MNYMEKSGGTQQKKTQQNTKSVHTSGDVQRQNKWYNNPCRTLFVTWTPYTKY